ncbi:hypothetical protein [Spirosoma oryzae]|uniref:hypothetical protein n=1 Tax=Spirosoma oryzae TaxID=1469603 RepID=UPI0011B2777D|nr:hypothetical protein [Spirosoma oryzae]
MNRADFIKSLLAVPALLSLSSKAKGDSAFKDGVDRSSWTKPYIPVDAVIDSTKLYVADGESFVLPLTNGYFSKNDLICPDNDKSYYLFVSNSHETMPGVYLHTVQVVGNWGDKKTITLVPGTSYSRVCSAKMEYNG